MIVVNSFQLHFIFKEKQKDAFQANFDVASIIIILFIIVTSLLYGK